MKPINRRISHFWFWTNFMDDWWDTDRSAIVPSVDFILERLNIRLQRIKPHRRLKAIKWLEKYIRWHLRRIELGRRRPSEVNWRFVLINTAQVLVGMFLQLVIAIVALETFTNVLRGDSDLVALSAGVITGLMFMVSISIPTLGTVHNCVYRIATLSNSTDARRALQRILFEVRLYKSIVAAEAPLPAAAQSKG